MKRFTLHFRPALLDSLKTYRRQDLMADVGAGLTVACVALPLAMAFGIASGVKPEQGLITAIIGGALVSLLGGSKVQIGGPAGAFVAMLYGIAMTYGMSNLLLATMMAGVVLFLMGALQLGQIIRFVPISIVIGFTNGIAVVIMLSQLKDFLGLRIEKMPANFFSQLDVLLHYRDGLNLPAVGLGLATLVTLFLWPKPPKVMTSRQTALEQPAQGVVDLDVPTTIIDPNGQPLPSTSTATSTAAPAATPASLHHEGAPRPGSPRNHGAAAHHQPLTPTEAAPQASALKRLLWRIPAPLVVLLFGTVLTWWLQLPLETIGSRFGGIPQSLPSPVLPSFDWQSAQNLVGPTLAIAFLGAIESLLCARVADGMAHDRHDPNQELMAQGIANFTTPLFGGIAVTGTIARTVTNIRSGAHSPIAGVVHALTLLVFMLLLAPLAVNIPMSVLAGILLFVGFNMGDWRAFARLRRFTLNYRTVLVTTFLLTVVFDLTVAVQFGLLLASFFFVYRVARVTRVDRIEAPADVATLPDGRSVGVWQAYGSIFFGSISKLEAITATPQPLPNIVVLDLHRVITMDTTGLDALQTLHNHILEHGHRLIVCGANRQPTSLMNRAGFLEELGKGNCFESLEQVYEALVKRPEARPQRGLP
ncbi:STAS domain-containing protein [Lautropia dentalis]|uniref:STAS domain-containing protein n=1 Tax=Lautropia dentalis TaxID=2490857 RepID=A0A3R8LSI8_9BURK|nr:SulP family inorganic anion transporter [Lautropia dentalis]RRN45246.1 STAS domain-containing protein [Lautropia dentalis]